MELTPKQDKFVKSYIETGNATKAALEAYDTIDYQTAASIGHENLKKPEIKAVINATERDIQAEFKDKAGDMLDVLYKLATTARSELVRAQAAKDLLDRAGYKPADKREISGPNGTNLTIESRVSQEIQERTRKLLDNTIDI